MDITNAYNVIEQTIKRNVNSIKSQIIQRGVSAANELRNSVLHILAGQRSGRRYRVPGTKQYYTASAPGEAPANRTGILRNSYKSYSIGFDFGNVYEMHSIADSSYRVNGRLLGDMLERGTKKIKPRPFKQASIDRAKPKILSIYKRQY